jgi:hypothetical protein
MDSGRHTVERRSPFAGRIIERPSHRNRHRSTPAQGKDRGRPRGFRQRLIFWASTMPTRPSASLQPIAHNLFQPTRLPNIMSVKVG